MGVRRGLQAGRVAPEGGTLAAVTSVLAPPEGRNDAQGQHLVLGKSEGERGGAAAPSPVPFRWLV